MFGVWLAGGRMPRYRVNVAASAVCRANKYAAVLHALEVFATEYKHGAPVRFNYPRVVYQTASLLARTDDSRFAC